MATNVEIKARVRRWRRLLERAAQLADGPPRRLEQVDTFFAAPHGRLKLRVQEPGHGELIHYHRPDDAGPKASEYHIVGTDDPDGLAAMLGAALGVAGEVRKVRLVYMCGQTRVHLDEVEGLGHFMELEVVLEPGQPLTWGEAEARRLMEALQIEEGDLVQGAYFDLLPRSGST